MHQIRCPWCGMRDEAEFQYGGDATMARPSDHASEQAFYDFVYTRANPRGWHLEWWHHVAGCRQWLKAVRHTVTHEIADTGKATERLEVPDA